MPKKPLAIGKYKGNEVYIIWTDDKLCGILYPEEYPADYTRVVFRKEIKSMRWFE